MAIDRTPAKYDTKHVTVYLNRAHPTDPYNGKVDGIAIAPNSEARRSAHRGGNMGAGFGPRSRDLRDVGLHRRRRQLSAVVTTAPTARWRSEHTAKMYGDSSNLSPRYAPDGSAVLSNPVSMSVGASILSAARPPQICHDATRRAYVRQFTPNGKSLIISDKGPDGKEGLRHIDAIALEQVPTYTTGCGGPAESYSGTVTLQICSRMDAGNHQLSRRHIRPAPRVHAQLLS